MLSLVFLTCLPLAAQFDPEGAQVISYFPHFADGGPTSQKWTTALTFVNPHGTATANAFLLLFGNDGSPLSMDFGGGAASRFTFIVPPQGTFTFTSVAASSTIVTGWAFVSSSLPLEGVVQFRYSSNGVPLQGVSAQSTPASQMFRSPATTTTGIAIANPYTNPSLSLTVWAYDSAGFVVASTPVSIGPRGHQAFVLAQLFPNLPGDFRGSVVIANSIPDGNNFVAWTISGDSGVLSSYPPSGLNWPVSQYERIWKVWEKILNGALHFYPQLSPEPQLVIDYTTAFINSFADPAQNQVHIFMNLAELTSDSESELAFVIAHEMGHIIQAKIKQLAYVPSNKEYDADYYGMVLSLGAGYDPYGAAGALAKLSMASGHAGLVDQNFENSVLVAGVDLHGSFNNRLDRIFDEMQAICAMPQNQSSCAKYKSLIHPHLPVVAPLNREAPVH
jgi:hypothetical protein